MSGNKPRGREDTKRPKTRRSLGEGGTVGTTNVTVRLKPDTTYYLLEEVLKEFLLIS
jgi:hypothetical protein